MSSDVAVTREGGGSAPAVGFSASPCFHPVTRPGTALQGAGGVGLGFCAWFRLYYQIVVFFLRRQHSLKCLEDFFFFFFPSVNFFKCLYKKSSGGDQVIGQLL